MANPQTPFTVTGRVYEVIGSTNTAVVGALVTAHNFTNGLGETISTTTNAQGEYELNLANLPTAIATNDVVYLLVSTTNKKSGTVRGILNLTVDDEWNQDIYLKNVGLYENGTILKAAVLSGGEATLSLVEKDTDRLIGTINNAANETNPVIYDGSSDKRSGIRCIGGLRLVLAALGTNIQNQSAGVDATNNSIGDTSSNANKVITLNAEIISAIF